MTISRLGIPAIVQVQAVGDKNPNPNNPKKGAPKNTKPEKRESNTNIGLNNNQLDIPTLMVVINQKIMPSINTMVALQSYEDMKNK